MALPLLQCLVRKKYEAFVLLLIVYIVSSWYCFHRSKDGLLFSGPTDLSLLTSSMMMMMNSSRYKNQSNNSYYYYNYYNYYYNYWQSSKQTKSRKPLLPSFPVGRSKRFPSIEERVKVYMGHWYLPPCDKADAVYYSYSQYKNNRSEQTVVMLTKGNELVHRLGTSAASRKPFFAKQSDFENCNEKYKHDKRIRHECMDVQETIPRSLLWKETTAKTIAINPDKMMNDTMVANDDDDDNKKPPIVLRFGDDSDMQRIPTIQKWKPALSSEELANLTTGNCSRHDVLSQPLPPVVWLLNSKRHYRFVHNVADADTVWELKKNRAIFRGGLTGFGRYPNLTNEDRCDLYPRCSLVLRYANSSLVDAKLTSTLRRLNSSVVNGINLVGKKVSLGEQLQYKAVIFLEGNGRSFFFCHSLHYFLLLSHFCGWVVVVVGKHLTKMNLSSQNQNTLSISCVLCVKITPR